MALTETPQTARAAEKFLIVQYSQGRAILFGLIFIFGSIWGIYSWVDSGPVNTDSWLTGILFLAVPVALIAVGVLLGIWLGSATAEITLDHKGLTRKWVSRYFLHFSKERFIPWNNMLNYRFESEYNSESFTLKLKEGKPMKIVCFHNDIFPLKGDLPSFHWHFPKFIDEWNAADNSGVIPIVAGKSFYASIAALVIAIIMVLLAIVVIVAAFMYSTKRAAPYGIMVLLFGAIGAFVGKVMVERRKN